MKQSKPIENESRNNKPKGKKHKMKGTKHTPASEARVLGTARAL
jgi:hypothetical protein